MYTEVYEILTCNLETYLSHCLASRIQWHWWTSGGQILSPGIIKVLNYLGQGLENYSQNHFIYFIAYESPFFFKGNQMSDTDNWQRKSKGPGHQNSFRCFPKSPLQGWLFFLQVEEREFLKVLDKRHQDQKTIEFGPEWKNEIYLGRLKIFNSITTHSVKLLKI